MVISTLLSKKVRCAGALPGVVFLALAASPAFASVALCPMPPATTSDFITPYVGGGNTPITNGCDTSAGTFGDFGVGSANTQTIKGTTFSSSTVPTPTSAQIFLTTAPSNPNLIEIFGPGPGYYPGTPPTGGGAYSSTNYCGTSGGASGSEGWCVTGSNQYVTSQVTFDSVFSHPVSDFGFSGAAFASSVGSPTALLFLEVCPGTLTFSTGCTGYQVLEAGISNGNATSVSFALDAAFSATVDVASRETILVSTGSNSASWATVNNLDLIDAPEPASLLLTAGALLLLSAIRWRSRLKNVPR